MKVKLFMLSLALSALFGCTKDDDDNGGEIPTPQFAELEVTVRLCDSQSDPFCTSAQPVAGASVKLYEHKQFRDQGDHIAFEGTTGGGGKLLFTTLDTTAYWITVRMPAPDGRSQKIYEDFPYKTPLRTRSFLDVIFEEQ